MMSENDEILEPPGSIAIIGGGILGLEAALYGRFLGYDVQVFEAARIGQWWEEQGDVELGFLPGRAISGLAWQAIQAQRDQPEELPVLPTTMAEWGSQIVQELAEVDLLRGRVLASHRVTEVTAVPNEEDPNETDFVIRCDGAEESWEAEAIIDTTGLFSPAEGEALVPYRYRLTQPSDNDFETKTATGRDQICQLFAQLGDRPDLDLFRPTRT
ncbi:hypothetical protein FF011L_46600 [Roseimaritima multifibrata]|uniref:Uncharacterized protein n=1 Tax=Roseimaritima multifibrata TaxID=1930274 RepID=A0A517MLW5_9BACT|nr:hypothetical protein [Roseimaritima multifibrata]QDS95859.1 hypothetical protein FF011L_46600 [Roseimaritima multifibrata]